MLLFLALAALAVVVGFQAASSLRWAGDDIFITLRYAANWVAGKGIVYNTGERVEGYSHFLWLVFLALFERLGFDPLQAALGLGLASYVVLIGVLARASWALDSRGARLIVPFTSLALAVHYEAAVWATGGLETSFFALLLVLGFTLCFFTSLGRNAKLGIAGVIAGLAALTRPDGALFAALAAGFVLARATLERRSLRHTLKEAALFAGPVALLVLPHLAWRLAYYGDPLPNTYYAKSAGSAYWSQGFFYLWTYFRCYPTSWLFLLAIPAGAGLVASAFRSASDSWRARLLAALSRDHAAAMAFALAAVVAYLLLFVARVGGDFMYGRFLVPVLPFVFLLVEWSVPRLNRRWAAVAPLALVLLVAIIATVERGNRDRYLIKHEHGAPAIDEHRGIVDERWYYLHGVEIAEQRQMGKALAPYFAGLGATVLSRGQACFGYYAGFDRLIDNNGLTDRTIAHQPLAHRGRVGHERSASYDYLIQRGTDFVFRRPMYRNKLYRVAWFNPPGGHPDRAEIMTYHPARLVELKHRMGGNFQYLPFEQVLDDYIRLDLPGRSLPEVRADYQEFREYYFLHNRDPAREWPFILRLSDASEPARTTP